jgi:hypothetical protein
MGFVALRSGPNSDTYKHLNILSFSLASTLWQPFSLLINNFEDKRSSGREPIMSRSVSYCGV